MKIHKLIKIILCTVLMILILTSCSHYKSVSCPDFGKNRNYAKAKKNNKQLSSHFGTKKKVSFFAWNSKKLFLKKPAKKYNINFDEDILLSENIARQENLPGQVNNLNIYPTIFSMPSLLASDKRGDRLPSSKTINLYDYTTNYNNNRLSLNNISVNHKAGIHKIKNTKISNKEKAFYINGSAREAQGFAIASVITGITGLFILGLPLGILSLVFGGIAFARINENPQLKGKGLAIAGIVLGFIDVIGAITVIYIMTLS